MALQFIVRNADLAVLCDRLAEHVEIFRMDDRDTGVSIPTKVVDDLGEAEIRRMLAPCRHYDLWAGAWHGPAPRSRGFFTTLLDKIRGDE